MDLRGPSHTATNYSDFSSLSWFEREVTRARNPFESRLITLFYRSFTGTFFCRPFLFLKLLSVFFFFLRHEVE